MSQLGALSPPLGGGMRSIAQVLAMACFLALGTAGRAWAQHPQTREGFWIGFGFVTGVGYDVRVARNTSITPVANFNWGAPESGVKQPVFQIALGITFH